MTKYRYRSQKYKRGRYNKSYKTGKKKLVFPNRFFWLVILFLVALGIIIYFFVFSSFFQIKNIDIYGGPRTPRIEIKNIIYQQIDKEIAFVIPRNIFLINLKEINQIILEKFPRVREVVFKRKLPASLFIKIEERIPIGVWCKVEEDFQNCFRLDREGIVFEESNDQGKLIVKSEREIILGEKIIEEDYLKIILNIKKELISKQEIEIEEFFVPREQEKLVVKTSPAQISQGETLASREGWEIYFNPKENISDQLFNLKLILKEKISPSERENLEYIDLRFGNRVFYRSDNK